MKDGEWNTINDSAVKCVCVHTFDERVFFCSHWGTAPRWWKWLDGKLFSGTALTASLSDNRVREKLPHVRESHRRRVTGQNWFLCAYSASLRIELFLIYCADAVFQNKYFKFKQNILRGNNLICLHWVRWASLCDMHSARTHTHTRTVSSLSSVRATVGPGLQITG